MKERIISGAVLVVLMFALGLAGGNILLFAMLLISLRGMFELYRVFGIHLKPVGVLGYIFCVLYYLNLGFADNRFFIPIAVLFLIALLTCYVITFPKYHADQILVTYFGFFYVDVMLSYIYRTRMLENGIYIVWLIFLCSWISDTCAYFTGVAFGKHQMAPKLSPKKSVEGAIGGIMGSTLLTALYVYLLRNTMQITTREILLFGLFAGIGAVISMIGDLAASAIKRNYDIKDYGRLIPGHGGILDRFDSVIITAPMIFYLGGLL